MVSDTRLPSEMLTEHTVISSGRTMSHEPELVIKSEDYRTLIGHAYISWPAVIAGSLTALAFLLLFSSLAIAIGISAYRGENFGWGAGIWAVVTTGVAFFIGGCLVSYLSPYSEQRSGIVHGMLAWVLGVILIATLFSGAMGLFHGMIFADVLHTPGTPVLGSTYAQMVGAAWTAFFSLIVGLLAAVIGGVVGFKGKFVELKLGELKMTKH